MQVHPPPLLCLPQSRAQCWPGRTLADPLLHLHIDQLRIGEEVLRTTTIVLYDPLGAHCRRRTVGTLLEMVEYNLIVDIGCVGESDQVLVVGMEDDCHGLAVTGDNSRVILDGLSFS